jgi:Putative glycolipid-binding
MLFENPPPTACWQHQGLRSGFEVAYFRPASGGLRVHGTTTGLQDGDTWVVTYCLHLDESWSTRAADIVRTTVSGVTDVRLECDGAGHWMLNGEPAGHLDGCVDVDLESSAMTNALPIHGLVSPCKTVRRRRPPTCVPLIGASTGSISRTCGSKTTPAATNTSMKLRRSTSAAGLLMTGADWCSSIPGLRCALPERPRLGEGLLQVGMLPPGDIRLTAGARGEFVESLPRHVCGDVRIV